MPRVNHNPSAANRRVAADAGWVDGIHPTGVSSPRGEPASPIRFTILEPLPHNSFAVGFRGDSQHAGLQRMLHRKARIATLTD
jgi:hypothetical protein